MAAIRCLAALALCALAIVPPLHSQNITGAILGTVTDASGAAISGAGIDVRNVETNQITTIRSDGNGLYQANYLRPGFYQVSVTMRGFKRSSRDNVSVRVEDRVRLDFQLEVGDAATTVEVTTEAPLLDSDSASLGEVISTRSVEELPTLGRNIFDLVGLAAGVAVNPRAEGGVASTGNASAPTFVQSDISINGGRFRTNEYLVDGVSIMLPENNNFAFSPTPSGTQEFKVLTNSFGAQYGRSGGGVVSVVTRGGSNQFHGTGYEFFRNQLFKANNWFNNTRGLGRGQFRFHQFGGAFSGRLKRDRTFFFAEYQGHREFIGGGSGILTVPTPREAAGDFSQRVNATGQRITIYDPAARSQVNGVFLREAFPGNIIPASRQSPLARNLLKFLPAPNFAGTGPAGINNYVWERRQTVESDQWSARIDHRFSERFNVFGRVTRNTGLNAVNGPFGTIADNVTGDTVSRVGNLALNGTYVLSPSSILNARLGATRRFEGRVPLAAGKVDLTALGFAPNIAAAVDEQIFPLISIQNFATIGPPSGDRIRRGNQVYTAILDHTLIRGRHTIVYGGDFRLYDQTPFQAGASSGSYSFTQAQTRGPDALRPTLTSGEGLASYLMGFGGGSIASSAALAIRNPYYGLYVNDDIKFKRLTLNLGLRWEYDGPRTERYNRFGFFDFDSPFPIAIPGLPNLKGVLRYSGQDGQPRGQYANYFRNFGPRGGIAWRLDKRTVVRLGYGIFFAPRFGTTSGSSFGTPGYSVTTPWVSSLDDVVLLNPFDNPFPNGLLQRTGDLADRVQLGQSIVLALRDNNKSPYNQQWNVSVQRQLPKSTLIEATYAGNKGSRLPVSLNYNQVHPQHQELGTFLNRTAPNPFFGLVPSGTLSLANVSNAQLLRPFPQYVTVSTNSPALAQNIGSSNYHSLQLRLNKRFGRGYSVLATFTGSKLIDNGSGRIFGESAFVPPVQDAYNLAAERAISEGDVARRVSISHTVELPFGRGRHWLPKAGRLLNGIVGGWTASGAFSSQTGFPLALSSIGNSGVSGQVLRPNSTGKSATLTGPAQQRLGRYFDITQFTVPPNYTFGNVTRTLPDTRSPGRTAYNLSLAKAFPVAEGKFVSFRADSFNLANTPYFSRPGQALGGTNFGVIDTASGERVTQFAIKFTF